MRIAAIGKRLPPWMTGRWGPLIVALLVAAAIRIGAIDFSLWYDETAAIKFAHQPISLLWSGWSVRETNPPLYYSLLRFWMMAFGESDIAVKALPVTIGLVSIALLYRAALLLTDSQAVAFIAAMLTAVAEPHVHFSLEGRGYILAYAGAMAALAGIVQLWQRMAAARDRKLLWPLVQYVLGAAIAVYSHTTLIIFVGFANLVVLGLFILQWRRFGRIISLWIAANIVLAVIWAWWGWITFQQASGHNSNIAWLLPPTVADGIDAWRSVFTPFRGYGVPLLFELLLAGTFAHAAWRGRYRTVALLMLGCVILLPALMFLISQKVPVYVPKTLFAATGLMALALGAAITGLPLWPRIVIFVLLTLGSIAQLGIELPRRERDQWDVATTSLLAHKPPMRLFIADEGVAVAIDHYCERALHRLCPIDINLVDARRDWSYKLTRYPRIDAAKARSLTALGDYATITWSAPPSSLDYLAPQPGMTRDVIPLGTLGKLVYWHQPARR